MNLEYNPTVNLKSSKISGPISISSNSGWATAKAAGICTGNGTYSDPYVIEDLVIIKSSPGKSGIGISISQSYVYFKIENCTISGFSNGISLYYANNGTLFENNCSNNIFGISTNWCNNNSITGNIADDNLNSGIFLDNSLNHIISNNTCSRNVEIGMYIQNSNYNIIYENYLIDNGWNNGWDDELNNQWDNGMIGNYWSDYSGVDANDDGRGDTPYNVPGEGIQDHFPIWDDGDDLSPLIAINSPSDGNEFGTDAPSYNVTITDAHLSQMWYSLDGGAHIYYFTESTGTINQTAWQTLAQGEITITFYAIDLVGNIASKSVIVIKSIPSGLDPIILTTIVVSIVGGVAIVSVVYIFMRRRSRT